MQELSQLYIVILLDLKKNPFNFLVKLRARNKESECMHVLYLRFFVKCSVFYFLKGSLPWDFFLFFL